MKLYKGFDKNLQCRGFQYEIGKDYSEPNADLCNSGFHACEYPLDCFGYYNPADSRFCEVELDEVSKQTGSGDSKRCGKHIKIGAEIGLKGIVEASVNFTLGKVDWNNSKESNTGDYSVATNTGNQSVATNTGYRSVATNTGDYSVATNIGYHSVATNTGNQSVATNTGYRSVATNTGDYSVATNIGYHSAAANTGNRSVATNTGDYSVATNTGNRSAATNTGNQSVATVSGNDSVAIATGYQSKAKANLGSAIVIAERGDWNGSTYPLIAIKSAIVDGEIIKSDVWYTVKNGEFVELDNNI